MLEVNNKRLDSDIVAISLKIPRLEEEKQNFVLTKNFKEAGRISNEIKIQKEEKEKIQTKMTDNKHKIDNLKESSLKCDEELNHLIDQKGEEEKELNIVQYEYLLITKERLIDLIEKYKNKNNNDYIYLEEELSLFGKELKNLSELKYIKERFNVNEKIEIEETKIKEDNSYEIKVKTEEKETKIENPEQIKSLVQEAENMINQTETNSDNPIIEANNTTAQPVMSEEEKLELKNKIQKEITDLEVQISECINSEDYDKADELQNTINNLQIQLKNII